MQKAPGTDTNHWHCTLAELQDLEAKAKAGLSGVYAKSVKTYQVKNGSRYGSCYRVYEK